MELKHPNFEEGGISSLRQILRSEHQAFREEKRSLLLKSRRLRLDDVEKNSEEISCLKLCELAVMVRKGKATVACLKEVKKAVCIEHNIETFMRVNGVLPALVGILTGKDPDKQLEAVECFINLTCGSHGVTHKIAKSVGIYLIVYIQGSSYLLQDLCAWVLGNIANDCKNCFNLLKAQGLLPAVVGLLQSTFSEVIHSAIYCLRACTKYQDSLSDLMQLDLPHHIISVFAFPNMPYGVLVDATFILCNISYQMFGHMCRMDEGRLPRLMVNSRVEGRRPKGRPRVRWIDGVMSAMSDKDISFQEVKKLTMDRKEWRRIVMQGKCEMQKEIGNIVLQYLHNAVSDVVDISLATPLIRCLGYLTCGSNVLCEFLCCHRTLTCCIASIFNLGFHHLKTELLWPLTNILVSSKSSFDLNPILNNIHIFLGVLDSGVIQALYFLCVLVHVKPETKEAIQNRGVLSHVEVLMSCGKEDVMSAANVFHAAVNSQSDD